MDTLPPFASGADRLRLIYRFPLTGRESSVLVIGSEADADSAFDRSARTRTIEAASPDALPTAAAYDVVALPGALASSRVARVAGAPSELLRRAHSAVRPGGLIVGHLDQLASAHGLRQVLQGRTPVRQWIASRAMLTGRACRRALLAAGFIDVECFYVEPRIESPMALVPVHSEAARVHFLRAVRRTQGQYSAGGYLARIALAQAGWGGLLQPQVFFWARRPE